MSTFLQEQASPHNSTSPPPETPRRRFKEISAVTEWIEDYKPGGFHPVHIGDSLSRSRYEIIRKLGYGSYSTVWLAKDREFGYAAIKILIADNEASQNEVKVFEILSGSPIDHPGRAHVMTLREKFELHGPNGTHCCLVFDVMGPSAEAIAGYLPTSIMRKEKQSITDRSFPLWMTRAVLRQVLEGIDFMHQNQIAHGDVQPGNILFGLQDLTAADESLLMQNMTPRDPQDLSPDAGISEPVQSLDGQVQSGAPKYLVMDQPLTNFVRLKPPLNIKISDLGAAFRFSEPPVEPLTPVALRSPECILGGSTGPNQDIWSFGCLIHQFITGYPPFTIMGYDDEEEDEETDDHFTQLSSILGPLPKELLSKWSRSSLHYDSEGKPRKAVAAGESGEDDTKAEELNEQADAVNTNLENASNETSPHDFPSSSTGNGDTVAQNASDGADGDADFLSLEDIFRRYRGPDVDDAEAAEITQLIRSILQYDVQQRPTASQLLKHPWFAGSS